jgi:glutamine---fructose-6-phosphate transaminase (isomerizing)
MSLRNEIFEQPDILSSLLAGQMAAAEQIAESLHRQPVDYVFLAARGTSDNAGRYANYLWGALNRLPVALATPSLFTMYERPPRLKNCLVVGISQSGRSPDIVEVLAEGRRQGCPTLAITNATDSALAQAADFVIDIQAGEERAVAATKTYTGQLMAIAMLAAALSGEAGLRHALEQVPEWVGAMLQQEMEIARIAARYRYMHNCVVLGRGFNYSTAFEWSLKLKELAYVLAEPYSSADFLHGPIAMVERGFPVMAVAPAGKVFDSMIELLQRLHDEQQAELLVLSDDPQALGLARSPVQLPSGIPEWLTPLVAIIPAQLFAMHLTKEKGFDAEAPRSIHKVTETH